MTTSKPTTTTPDAACMTFDEAVARIRPHCGVISAHTPSESTSALIEHVWQLPPGDFDRLAATHIGVHPSTRAMLDVAGDVLRRLPSSVARREEELRAEVRGPVAWVQTMQRRAATADPTVFVCRPTERRYDTPIGRIVKFALSECSRIAVRSQLQTRAKWAKAVWRKGRDAQRLLQHPKLAGVRLCSTRFPKLLDQVERRRPQLQPVIDFVRLIRAAFEEQDELVRFAPLSKRSCCHRGPARLFELEIGLACWSASSRTAMRSLPVLAFCATTSVRIARFTPTLDESRCGGSDPSGSCRCPCSARAVSTNPDRCTNPPTETPQTRLRALVRARPAHRCCRSEADGRTCDRRRARRRERNACLLADAAAVFGKEETPQGLVVAWNATGRPAPVEDPRTDQVHLRDAVDVIVAALSPCRQDGRMGQGRPESSSADASARMRVLVEETPLRSCSFRRALHRLGVSLQVDFPPISGVRRRADVVFTRAKVAVFVDGCFWHGCPEHATWPKQTPTGGAARSRRTNDVTVTPTNTPGSGLGITRIWEHEDMQAAAERVWMSWLVNPVSTTRRDRIEQVKPLRTARYGADAFSLGRLDPTRTEWRLFARRPWCPGRNPFESARPLCSSHVVAESPEISHT